MPSDDYEKMLRLRHEVFVKRLGWDVMSIDGKEFDEYDLLKEVTYIVIKSPTGNIDACWRLLPSTGNYMLKDTFPQLLGETPPIVSEQYWELSRFAVATNRTNTGHASLGPIPLMLMQASATFAVQNGISHYLTVTTPALFRMLKSKGLNVNALGPSKKIGISTAQACIIHVDMVTLAALVNHQLPESQ